MQMLDRVAPDATSVQRNAHVRSDRWLKVEGGNSQNQSRLLYMNDDLLRLADHCEASEMSVTLPLGLDPACTSSRTRVQCTSNAMWPGAT